MHSRSIRLLRAQGVLRGYDQATNLILDDCFERVFSTKVQPGMAMLLTTTRRHCPRCSIVHLCCYLKNSYAVHSHKNSHTLSAGDL